MKKIALIITAICFAALCFNGFGAPAPATTKASSNATAPEKTISTANLLVSDSGTNLSIINATFTSPGVFGISQATKFTAPKPGWKLEGVRILGTDGWNSSNKEFPVQGIFGLEIRDSNLRLLYQYADTQLEYFTSPNGVKYAQIEIPATVVNGDFYVCFYGRDTVKVLTELQNSTGKSYYFVRETGQLLAGVLQLKNNTTLPVNWIIRAIGE